jgi:hypothetical protein
MRQLTLVLLLACTLGGCSESRVLWRGDVTLGDTLIVLPAAASFRAVGQRRAICVEPASDTMFAKQPIQLDVYLVRKDGTRDRLGWRPDTSRANASPVLVVTPDTAVWSRRDNVQSISPAGPPRMRDDGRSWCAVDWNGPRYFTNYLAVAIRSSSALRITELRWVTTWPSL